MLVKGLLAVLPVVCEAYHYGFAGGGQNRWECLHFKSLRIEVA